MDIFITTLQSVAILVLMAIPGFIIAKLKMIDIDKAVSFLSVLVLFVCQPFITFDAFLNINYSHQVLINVSIVFFATLIFLSFLLIVFTKLYKFSKDDLMVQKQCAYGSAFGNVGHMGIPLLQLIHPGNPAIILYQSVILTAFNIIGWTLGAYQLSGDKKFISLKKAFLNPASISFLVVLPFFITNTNFIKYDIKLLETFISLFSKMVGPLVMISIGIKVSEIKVKELFLDKNVYITSVLKLIIAPLIMFGIVKLVELFYDLSDIKINLITLAAMPIANNLALFSAYLDLDTQYASKITIFSVFLSILTIPAIFYLFTF